MLATYTVNVDYDAITFNDQDSIVTLREAIFEAESNPNADIIVFASNLNGATITLGRDANNNPIITGELSITESVTIDGTVDGDGPSEQLLNITIDASGNDPTPNSTLEDGIANDGDGSTVFYIESAGAVEINGLTLTGGDAAAGVLDVHGGAVSVFNASLTLRNSLISGNVAEHGGGVNFYSPNSSHGLNVISTTIRDNSASTFGGGLSIDAIYSFVSIQTSVIAGNDCLGTGGGLYANVRDLEIAATTISGNVAHSGLGGGVEVRLGFRYSPYASKLEIDRSTISGNTADMKGGGFFVLLAGTADDKVILSNSTISGNHALNGVGGGVYVCQKFGGKFEAFNSTISGNDALHSTMGYGGGLAIAREGTAPALDSYLDHLTITDNEATTGGGLYSANDSLVRTYVNNTIISGNRNAIDQPNNVAGNIEDTSSFNLLGSGGGAVLPVAPLGPGNIHDDDPMLGPLVYNGGPVFLDGSKMLTHPPLPTTVTTNPGSPAINAGNTNTTGFPQYDQRGNPWSRVVGGRVDIGAIEQQANPLPGDYDLNGSVEYYDFQLWIDTFESTTDLRADGNGNGIVDLADYTIWADAYGTLTGRPIGDFDGNGTVDIGDYNVWVSTFGSTEDLDADANGNGIVDLADYTIWRDTFGSMIGAAKFGLLSAAFGPDVPPEVVGLALAGSAAFDFTAAVGSGEQLRSIPHSGANAISLTFNQDVVVSQNDLVLINLDGTAPSVASFAYNSESQTATWTFSTSFSDGRYLLRLTDAVEDLGGEALDGEFSNPWALAHTGSDVFPSGDGVAGGEFRFRFTVLAGDTDHNNIHGATNFQNWHSTEPGMVYVSTTADEYDGDLAFGDVSLREAVNYANTASEPTTIVLPTGKYTLSRTGTETSADVAVNDLDILGDVTIVGAGPGFTIIDNSGLTSGTHARTFEVSGSSQRLEVQRLTVANGSSLTTGQVASVYGGATLEIVNSAIVNHTAYAGAAAILVSGANVTVLRSVFTNNDNTSVYGGTAVSVNGSSTAPASITVGESIFALNTQPIYSGGTSYYSIRVTGTVAKTNQGKNLYDYAGGGFFDVVPGNGDYLGTPTYVVTSAADTFNHADDLEALSLREAVDLANNASTLAEIWVPAWRFQLTLDRGSSATDFDVAYGDLDVKKSMTIRGVADVTKVEWKPGIIDKVFEVLGDCNSDGQADYYSVSSSDYSIWQDQNGSTGTLEQFSADWDDDGDVDSADYTIWTQNFGHTLSLNNLLA